MWLWMRPPVALVVEPKFGSGDGGSSLRATIHSVGSAAFAAGAGAEVGAAAAGFAGAASVGLAAGAVVAGGAGGAVGGAHAWSITTADSPRTLLRNWRRVPKPRLNADAVSSCTVVSSLTRWP